MGLGRQPQMHPGIAGQPRQTYVTQISTAPSITSSSANPQYQQGKPQMQFKNMSTLQQQMNVPTSITMTQAMISQPQQNFAAMTGNQPLQVQPQQQQNMMGPTVSSHQQQPLSQMNLSHSQTSFNVSSAGTLFYFCDIFLVVIFCSFIA